jgi:hypothetical protein
MSLACEALFVVRLEKHGESKHSRPVNEQQRRKGRGNDITFSYCWVLLHADPSIPSQRFSHLASHATEVCRAADTIRSKLEDQRLADSNC